MTIREMKMPRPASQFAFAGLTCALMSACIPYYGPDVNEFAPATRPAGIAAVLDLGSDTLRAEILALDDDALIVLVDRTPQYAMAGRLARIPLTGIHTAEFENAGGFDYSFWTYVFAWGPPKPPDPLSLVTQGVAADPAIHERLHLLVRYPQGLDAGLLARLEGVYGEMETLELEALDNRNR